MTKLFSYFAFLLAISPAFSQWVALSRGEKNISYSIESGNQNNQLVTINTPGYTLETKSVNGKNYSVIKAPGYPGLTRKGHPDLPRIGANFLISEDQVPTMETLKDDYVDVQLPYPLISSKGHFTRDIPFGSIPYTFSEVYQKDAFYPEMKTAEFSKPFTIHNVRGINAHFNLFQYNPVKQTLRIHKSLGINFQNLLPKKKSDKKKAVPSFLKRVLSRSFVNYKKMMSPLGLMETNESGRMVIISADEFFESSKPFAAWKRKSGIPVKHVKMSEIGDSALDIKLFVQNEFNAGNLSFVHLIGDVEHVPTLRGTVERAHSDQSYGLLAGDDWYLDIIVSRFSVKSAADVTYQASKTIQYESQPDTESLTDSWYRKGMGIASNEGNPKDWKYTDTIRDGLMSLSYDSIDQIYDPGASATAVTDAVNEGRSVINYIGHGSSTSWVTSRFRTSHIKSLSNGNMLPYIWSVACVNGAFAGSRESFAETWMMAGNNEGVRGAIAIAAASTNMQWVPPLYWQAETNLVLLPNGNDQTFGGLSLGGMSRIAEKYGPEHKSFKMFVEQTNNFGDGSLKVRYDVPRKLEISQIKYSSKNVTGTVSTPEGGNLSGLTVTVYDNSMQTWRRTQTNTLGQFEIDFSSSTFTELSMTVTGTNVVPIVDRAIPLNLKAKEQNEKRSKVFKRLY